MLKLIILIGTLFLTVLTSKGFDFEYMIDYAEMICFRQSGYNFFVQRYNAQYPSGHYKNNLDAALKNNLKTDLALIPCRKLDPYLLVNDLFKNVGPTFYDRVWIVINEHKTQSCSLSNSCDYVIDLVSQLQQKNKTVGIKTSFNYFQQAMGWYNNCSQLSVLPLWYEEMDNSPSFSNFRSFNNWTEPSRKQYRGLSGCSARGGTEDYQS